MAKLTDQDDRAIFMGTTAEAPGVADDPRSMVAVRQARTVSTVERNDPALIDGFHHDGLGMCSVFVL